MWIKAFNFLRGLLGGKVQIVLLIAALALALALWLLRGENKALSREIGRVTAANAAQAESLAALQADREALDGILTARETELEKIRADFAARLSSLDEQAGNEPELAAWGALRLPGRLAGLRRGTPADANRSRQAHAAGSSAAPLP